jgi:hypothetical protein
MDQTTLNNELSAYGNVAYSIVTASKIVAFVESVTLQGYKAIFDYIETLTAEYPYIITISYDGSSVKFELLSAQDPGEQATDDINNAN